MGKFDSLQETSFSKKTTYTRAEELFSTAHFSKDAEIDYTYFENLNVQDLHEYNRKKKLNKNIITLWAKLEMKSFIDYQLGNTINPYFSNTSKPTAIKFSSDYNYMTDNQRYLRLLDIKYIKSLVLQGIKFSNIYMVTYEIMNKDDKFCPYVELYTQTEINNAFVKFAYGYDSNKNGKVELFIDSFNYPVLLNNKGFIELPLSGVRKKLDVYDYITDDDIAKILPKKN